MAPSPSTPLPPRRSKSKRNHERIPGKHGNVPFFVRPHLDFAFFFVTFFDWILGVGLTITKKYWIPGLAEREVLQSGPLPAINYK